MVLNTINTLLLVKHYLVRERSSELLKKRFQIVEKSMRTDSHLTNASIDFITSPEMPLVIYILTKVSVEHSYKY